MISTTQNMLTNYICLKVSKRERESMFNRKFLVALGTVLSISSQALATKLIKTIPIKGVWSIYIPECGSVASLRFKGQEKSTQPVPFQNVGHGEIRDTQSWNLLHSFEEVTRLNISPCGRYAGIVYDNGIGQIFDLQKDTILFEGEQIWEIIFSPANNFVRVIYENKIELYKTTTWILLKTFENTKKEYFHFSNDGRYFGVSYNDDSCSLIDSKTLTATKTFKNVDNFGLHFSTDNAYVAILYTDYTAQIFDTHTWKVIDNYEQIEHLAFLYTISGNYLLKKTIHCTAQLIDYGKRSIVLEQQNEDIGTISSNGAYCWFVSHNRVANVFNVHTGEMVLGHLEGVEECYFLGNNNIVIALKDTLQLFKLD